MVTLAKPNPTDLIEKLKDAIACYNDFSPSEFNERVHKYYTWRNVADRVEVVYRKVLAKPARSRLAMPRIFYTN